VTNHRFTLEQMQKFRANPSKPGGGGSMTGFWPPEDGPEEEGSKESGSDETRGLVGSGSGRRGQSKL